MARRRPGVAAIPRPADQAMSPEGSGHDDPAEEVAARFRQAIVDLDGPVPVSVTVGVAHLDQVTAEVTPQQLVAAAAPTSTNSKSPVVEGCRRSATRSSSPSAGRGDLMIRDQKVATRLMGSDLPAIAAASAGPRLATSR